MLTLQMKANDPNKWSQGYFTIFVTIIIVIIIKSFLRVSCVNLLVSSSSFYCISLISEIYYCNFYFFAEFQK